MHPDLLRLGRRREAERDTRSVGREDEVLRDSVTRQRQAVHPRVAVLVRDDQHAPTGVVADAVEIPVRLVHDLPAAAERVARDRRRCRDPRSSRRGSRTSRRARPARRIRPRRRAASRERPRRSRRRSGTGSCRRSARPELLGDDPPPVRRDLAVDVQAAELEGPLLAARRAAARRCRSRGRCGGSSSTRAACRRARRAATSGCKRGSHDERLVRRGVELRPLVPALVDLEQQPVVREQLPVDRLGVVRQLLELTTVEPTAGRAGACPAGREATSSVEPSRRPRQRIRLPQLEQRPQIAHG